MKKSDDACHPYSRGVGTAIVITVRAHEVVCMQRAMRGHMKWFSFDVQYRAALLVHSPGFHETSCKGAYPRPCQTQTSKTSSSLIINEPPVCCCRLQLGPPYFGSTGGPEDEFCFSAFDSIQAERGDHASGDSHGIWRVDGRCSTVRHLSYSQKSNLLQIKARIVDES